MQRQTVVDSGGGRDSVYPVLLRSRGFL